MMAFEQYTKDPSTHYNEFINYGENIYSKI